MLRASHRATATNGVVLFHWHGCPAREPGRPADPLQRKRLRGKREGLCRQAVMLVRTAKSDNLLLCVGPHCIPAAELL